MNRFGFSLGLITLNLTIAASASATTYDVVIFNGRVMDSDRHYYAVANVGIKDGRITAITEAAIDGAEAIDATGHVVAPGYIDLHAHGQNLGDYRMQAVQGVNTMLEPASGVLPVSAWYEDQGKKRLPIN